MLKIQFKKLYKGANLVYYNYILIRYLKVLYIKKYLFNNIMPKIYSKEEMQKTLNKMFEILQLTNQNNTFTLKKMDTDPDKQQQILALEEEITKNFSLSNWSYFMNKKKGIEMERPYINLIRGVFRACNVDFSILNTTAKIDNKITHITKYIIKF